MKTAISLVLVSLVSVFALSSCTNESPVSASASSDDELTSDARRTGHSEKIFAEDCIHGRGTFLGPCGQTVEFGFAAGIKNGAPRVHIRLRDQGCHVEGSGGEAIAADDEGFARTFSGTMNANGSLTPVTFEATAIDNGNDPANPDVFLIEFSNGYTAGGPITSGYIEITTHCQAPPGA
jgi:hypothetical protein